MTFTDIKLFWGGKGNTQAAKGPLISATSLFFLTLVLKILIKPEKNAMHLQKSSELSLFSVRM